MSKVRKEIAELIGLLPMFMKTLLEGSAFGAEAGLNSSEKRTLIYIYKHEGSTMSEYSKKVGLERGSFTAVADSLEEKGLIGRVSGSDDRRICALVLTGEGKKIAREIDADFKRHLTAKLASLTSEELNNLRKALETIATTIKIIQQ
ncbi:MAG TPA: MarR family transcriptional regulator [Firmicutes bacterium]|jgi:DNA-binding MarR family transcriptional regulator|nr:MarR family transcriptional regulator [Bacillota bacterium]